MSGVGFNLVASAPFVIGNIPFRSVHYQPSAPNQPVATDDPPPPYTEKPLQTKAKSVDDDFELL